MSKFRAILVSTLLASALAGGTVAAATTTDAKPAPVTKIGGNWCC